MDKYPRLVKCDHSVNIEINSSPFTLGRSWNCNYVILAESISRIHCSLERVGIHWILKDTSTNGTYINGMVIQSRGSRRLMNGDIINFDRQNEQYIFHFVPRYNVWYEQQSRVAYPLPSEIDIYPNSYSTVTPYTSVPTYRTKSTFRTNRTYRIHRSYRTELAYTAVPTYRTDNVPGYTTYPEYTNNAVHTMNPDYTTLCSYSTVRDYASEPEYSTGNENIIVHERSVVPTYRTVREYTTVPASPTDTASIEDSPSSVQFPVIVPTEVASPSDTPLDCTMKREMPKATSSSETENGEELRNEMQCSICSEMFIKATTLNCSHTFCKFCIETWRRNKSACPICRAEITSMNSTLVLDNVIEMVVQNGSEEVKQHRKEILEDRQKCVEQSKHKRGDSSTESRIEMVSEDSDSGDESDGMNWLGQMAGTNLERLYIPTIYCFYCDIRGHSSSNCPSRDLDDVHYRVLC
nr:E3 ubiquitin-protein ligase CHFR-like isoform X2 [Leptinotarsa decemlineata]